MASNSLSLSILTPKLHFPHNSSLLLHSLPLPSLSFSSNKTTSNILIKTTTTPKVNNQLWKIHAVTDDTTITSDITSSSSQDIIQSYSNDNDVTSTVIQVLLFVAFLGLSILTIGVIYLGVTDFLQKREKEKFEKEEAAKKKKGGKNKKKKKVRARAGPRGFGQKIEEDDFDDDEDA